MAFAIELEEWVGALWHRWATSKPSYTQYPEAAVELRAIQQALGVFFRLGGGHPGLAVGAITDRASGHRLSLRQRLGYEVEQLPQPRRDDEALRLPASIAVFPERELNRDLYFWLAALLAVAGPDARCRDPLQADVLAIRDARARSEAVLAAFPGLVARYQRLRAAALDARPPRHNLPPQEAAVERAIRRLLGEHGAASEDPLCTAVLDATVPVDEFRAALGYRGLLPPPLWGLVTTQASSGDTTEGEADEEAAEQAVQALPGGARKAVRKRQEQSERDDPLIFNRFEKMLSLAEMVNLNRMVDDDPDPKASKSADQLEELTLSPQAKKVASRLQVELDLAPRAAIAGQLSGPHSYPEWDYRRQAYLPAQSRVIVEQHPGNSEGWQADARTRRRIRRVQRHFEALRPRRVILRAQPDGHDLDTDAAVRGYCDQRATGQPNEQLFLASRQQARDLAVSILVDHSLSTEAWLEDRRIIDVIREALWVLAHGLHGCGEDYSIATFTSHRRQRVWFRPIKDFAERMGPRVAQRIAALEPGSYTRMGPAIRHAAAELALRPNRHRLLLLLSDGKPNDTDYYEGRYAIEDTRRAVLDAQREGIRLFAITVDREAAAYIPRLFGPGGYALVERPEKLVEALPRIYRQITRT